MLYTIFIVRRHLPPLKAANYILNNKPIKCLRCKQNRRCSILQIYLRYNYI